MQHRSIPEEERQRGEVWSLQHHQSPYHQHHQHLQHQHQHHQHLQQHQEQLAQKSPPRTVPPLATKVQELSFIPGNDKEGFPIFETISKISMRLDQRVSLIQELRKQITDLESENAWMREQTKRVQTEPPPMPTQTSSSSSSVEESLRSNERGAGRTDTVANGRELREPIPSVVTMSADDLLLPSPPPPPTQRGIPVEEINNFSNHHRHYPAPHHHLKYDYALQKQRQQQQLQQLQQLHQLEQQHHLQQLQEQQEQQHQQQWLDQRYCPQKEGDPQSRPTMYYHHPFSSGVAEEGAGDSYVGDDEGGEDGTGGGDRGGDTGRQEHGCGNTPPVNDEQTTAPKTARFMHPPSSFSSSIDIGSLSTLTDSRTYFPFRQSSSFDYLVAAAEVTSEGDLS